MLWYVGVFVGIVAVVVLIVKLQTGGAQMPRMLQNPEFEDLQAYLQQPLIIVSPAQKQVLALLRTLDQEQLREMKRQGGLPYAGLTPGQRDALLNLAKMRSSYITKEVDIAGSYIKVLFKPTLQFEWHFNRSGQPDMYCVGIEWDT